MFETTPTVRRRLMVFTGTLVMAAATLGQTGAPTRPAAAPAAKSDDGRLVLHEDFGALASGGLPAGWEAWTPEPSMKLRIEAGSPVTYSGKNSVRMSGNGNQHAKGSIRRQLTGLSPEKFYRFVVVYSTESVQHAHNSVYPFVTWGKSRQFQLLTPTGEDNGWTRAELTMRLPANASGTLTVELFAGWIPNGSVCWGKLTVTELTHYEPDRNPVRVAVIDSQPPKAGSLLDNADFYAAEIGRACRAERPDVILLPEHFNTTQVTGDSEVSTDSEYMGRLKDAAKTHRVNLVGSVHLRENGFLFNTGILINRQGKIAGKYHKSHLATPEALFTKITRGDELEVIETDFGKIGILVCYDYHFPEAVRTLVLKGAEILFVPLAADGRLFENGISMGTEYSGKAIVLDNRVPVVFAVTHASSKNPSMIIDNKAHIVAKTSDREHIIAGVVDTREKVFQWTGADFKSIYRSDRRPELYGPLGQAGQTADPSPRRNRETSASEERAAAGPLRVHPQAPRYFTDGTKDARGALRAVYLTGSHTWNNLVDMGRNDPPECFDFDAYLDFLARHKHNFIRLWAWDSSTWDSRANVREGNGLIFRVAPLPWARTGPGNALDGLPKFDLTKFDPEYFDRLRARVRAAGQRGIYVSVMLFEGWGMYHANRRRTSSVGWAWRTHPFHPENNINGIDAGGDAATGGPHRLGKEAVNAVQSVYIHRVVDTVNDLDNVLYEVINEGGERGWDWWVVKTVRDHERTKPEQHPVGITGHGAENLASMLASPADWISPGKKDGFGEEPPTWDGGKPSLLDTDHIWGVGGDAGWVWKSFLRGHNPIFMDPYDHRILGRGQPDQWDALRRSMGHTRRLAGRLNLAAMAPHDELASTKHCLAEPGEAYVVYLQESGEVSVDLASTAGTFRVEWIHPVEGTVTKAAGVSGGGTRVFKSPFERDGVLYLRKQP